MDLALADMSVLITGASGGIGRALAEAFAAEGASLVLHGWRRFEELQDWTQAQPWAHRALCVKANVTSPEAVRGAWNRAQERFGRVDIAVANAGVWPRADEPLHLASTERILRTLEVNLLGSTWTARAWQQALAEQGPRADGKGASLCFIGSTAGQFGEAGHADYAMAKAGLVGLMNSLKNEAVRLDPFARVNLVQPGWTVTHMVREELAQEGVIQKVTATMPLRQLARAADVARAVVVLSSPAASRHLSGQVLTVAGGMEGRTLWTPGEIDEAAVRSRLGQDP